ncbi:(2Fe-2S)-binding protein [Paenibacillus wynnii]|uniref:(2Fe-2S)-binding protein n=1 Tax=Paenibacillus wynnii TaxID=268407 RepID=UPI0027908C7E|nr:(2Fe-2S)-binding protein [Paenibacillus wynnii]MDQ0194310.1 ferric iron reductase protein FhuF [Paenibacillus wynnii]
MNDEQLIHELATKFDLQLSVPEGTQYSFAAADLVKEEKMQEFMECYKPLMKALDDTAVAAYFANWFSSAAMALQYTLSVFNTVPNMSLSNLSIHLVPASGYCRVVYVINQWDTIKGPADKVERDHWRQRVLSDFYKNTAFPLIHSISALSGLAASQIWGQLPTKFNYYLEILMNGQDNADTMHQLQMDYESLKNDLSPEIFGLAKNPFQVQVRRIEDLADPEKTVQMRNRCCLYYLTEGGNYCYTCPRLNENERADRREKFRRQAESS